MIAETTQSVEIPQAAIDALRGALLGTVIVPGESDYAAARAVWNAMIDRRPALIVRRKGTADVLHAVSFAQTQYLPVSIRRGGHNVAGHAGPHAGLMLDLSARRAARADAHRARA